ncbi:MAG: ATP phosphoribosyltransferase regulatory subunit, partial [Calditrichaeota bacterium]|nr:ATP phosphoribosyltransferase regulatory subunit [Calditrichota bacterium]
LSEIGIHNWEIAIGHAGLTRHILSSFGFDPYIIRFLSQQIPNLRNLELGKNYVRDSIISMLFDRAPSESFDDDYTLNIAQIISEPINNQWMVTNRSASDIARRLREKRARNSLRSTILDALDFLEEWCQIQGAVENVLPELLHALPTRAKSTGVLIKEWGKTLDLLNAYKIPADKIKINPDLTRKWDYYTGTVFELIVDRESIGGGGRYDEFAHLLGSKSNIPAVGFSYYGDMLRKTISTPTSEQTVYNVMVTNAEYLDIAISLSQRLRDLDIHLQISTVPSADNEQMTMIVENETTIKFRNQQYPISQLETLIHLLKI